VKTPAKEHKIGFKLSRLKENPQSRGVGKKIA
jgi:hypothetical protein